MEELSGLETSTKILARAFEGQCSGKLNRVHLVTTFWDQVDREVGNERERCLEDSSWQRFIGEGSNIHRFDFHEATSAKGILDTIIQGNIAEVNNIPIPVSAPKG